MTGLWAAMQADHDLVWSLLNRLTGADGSALPPSDAREAAQHLVAVESVHEAVEEQVIWPAVRRRCQDGPELVGEALSQEGQAKRVLNELRRIAPGSEEFSECVNTLAGMARTHLSYEQAQIWPRLADALTDGEAAGLERAWHEARPDAPTRPHPHTPPAPQLLGGVGRAMGRLDRVRDRIAGVGGPTH